MTFRELLKQDRPILGIYVACADCTVVEMAARAGMDYIRIDLEHGLLDYSTVAQLIRTATNLGMPVQARVADLSDITRLLDFGVTGVVIPDVDSVDYAKRIIDKVKYAPVGMRGMNTTPRCLGWDGSRFADYVKAANEEVLLGFQLESRQAVDNIDAILSLGGVDMISSGKADLSQSYGVIGQITNPLILEKEEYIIRKGLEYGKIPTVLSTSAERTKKLFGLGVRMLTIGSDTQIIYQAMKQAVGLHQG